MNNQELAKMVRASMSRQMSEKGVAIPVQVLLDVGVLSKQTVRIGVSEG